MRADPPEKQTMVLAKSPAAMLALLEGGVEIKELNVGNMGNGPGRRAVMRSIQLSPTEFETLKTMQQKGVRVYLQIFPDAKAVELDKVKL
jgi:PTS system mannose-specific IIB component